MTNQFARIYEYRIDAPGRPEHGRVVQFDGRTCPALHQREPYQLADGVMAHIDYIGPVPRREWHVSSRGRDWTFYSEADFNAKVDALHMGGDLAETYTVTR